MLEGEARPRPPRTLTSMYYLANSYGALGRQDEAPHAPPGDLALRKAWLGSDHLDTLASSTTWPSATLAPGAGTP